jgi:hypothetical protein
MDLLTSASHWCVRARSLDVIQSHWYASVPIGGQNYCPSPGSGSSAPASVVRLLAR